MKKLPKSRIEFEVSVAWDKWKKYLEQAVAEISEEIKNDPTNKFRHQWDRLIKEIKLRKIFSSLLRNPSGDYWGR